ncbi:Flavin-dependent monooxygenase, oxygenase subunit HsaA [Gimesia fumaroli]|uniref:Flavin-dependent monooxygenase, oxygenase subunit HsaA n=2 Tax=Gimesia fumaroli TaxID=2527976 RepID=A0A518I9R3_9PLAN|nr:Flavin-dependent monooxygenase, oxygenase subunit HsaA [Gimesia fumaroli]
MLNQQFPVEREEKRKALLAAVESVREIVASRADEAEEKGTLPQATVDALITSGLFTLKLPAVLGGAEADPVTQIEVIEVLSAIDPSTAWCMLNGTTSVSLMAAFLDDKAIAEIFDGGHIPTTANVAMPTGQAVPVDGGYCLSGKWAFASGIRHAQWVTAGVQVVRTSKAPPELRMMAVPVESVQIHDNWHVAGLEATGSCDVSITEHFIPEEFTWDSLHAKPQRGGPLYRLGLPGFVANEHAAFALGVGRCALDTVIGLANSKRRNYTLSPSTLEMRPTFQRAVGECDLKLRAARSLVMEIFTEVWATLCANQIPSPRSHAEMRSVAVFATEVAADVVTQAFRYGGGKAVYRTQCLQRCLLRDINVAAQHLIVSDIAYETHGQFALDLPDADPMR